MVHRMYPFFCIIIQFKFCARITGNFSFKNWANDALNLQLMTIAMDVRRMPGKMLYLFFLFFIVIIFLLLDTVFGGILIIKRKTIYSMKTTPKYYIRELGVWMFLLIVCNVVLLSVFVNVLSHWVLRMLCLFAFSLTEKIREFGCKKGSTVFVYFVFLYQFSCSYPTISCY